MPDSYVIRYGTTRNVGEFTAKGPKEFARNNLVLVRSDRGVEWGTVLCPTTTNTQDYLKSKKPHGKILRDVSSEDHQKLDEIHDSERKEFRGCQEMIRERKLKMDLVDAEHLFGGERIIFYYLAEERVDFRELVKSLAKKYHTRIEMRQIGVRDEAKLLADYGDCGKPVCCNNHLHEMPPVSMKMAKIQKASLDPTKISGRCGRLKCCLRYEYDTYKEYRKDLPPHGSTVVTQQGQGKVIAQEILTQKVTVLFEDRRQMIVDPSEILTVIKGNKKKSTKPENKKENPKNRN